MSDPDLSRRDFVQRSLAAVGPMVAVATLPVPDVRGGAPQAPLSVVCVGAHPDDPESGCGGTLALYAAAGHVVRIVYLTRGERGIDGKSLEDAAHIRTLEAEAACVVLGVTPVFFGMVDGATEVTKQHSGAMTKLIGDMKPDVVFLHWPVDTHPDHQVASLLGMRACMNLDSTSIYFFEVNAGSQTSAFQPNTYVDISSMLEKKQGALLAHPSQDGAGIWRKHHEPMSQWRGREMGVLAAEGFVRWSRGAHSPRLPRT
ncbi:MAG TPA: PIG-L deacetylase family protein [Gemmatimonadaceae bacterium]|nr:PIG-L deacetylase family protein [Gemmatimonadaceae bacterium]